MHLTLFLHLVLCYLLGLTMNGSASLVNHAIYVSVIEINHKMKTNGADVKVKIFTNDLQDALFNEIPPRIKLTDKNSCTLNKDKLVKYFANHLKLTINGSVEVIRFKSCEFNDQSIWLTFHTNTPKEWQSVSVKADYLMALFPTQSNIISVYHGEQKHMSRLTRKHPQETWTFNR